MMTIPEFRHIEQAYELIKKEVHRTPVLESRQFNKMTQAHLYFKCENFQRVGAFKFRGALHAVKQLSKTQAQKGVATHSSGNHGQAVALAAKMSGIPAYIVMPENAPAVKVEAVKGYGAEVIFCESTLKGREDTLHNVVEETGSCFIHPYNDKNVIAGQGTAALELLNEKPDLNVIMTPVGGGGLLSGTSIPAKATKSDIKVIGVEPEKADDAYQSFNAGKLIPVHYPDTVADGLRTSLGPLTFAVIKKHVDDIITVSESSIIETMRLIWERMKIIVEPSCAVPLAALLEKKMNAKNLRIGIILSGGNVDLDKLPWQS